MAKFTAREWLNGWNTHSVDKVLEHYAEDAELRSPESREAVRGKQNIHKNVQGWIQAFPDINGDLVQEIHSGQNVAVLLHMSGTHSGPLELQPGQPVQPTNKRAEMPVGIFFTLNNDGKIVKEQDIFDLSSLAGQLGIKMEQVAQPSRGATTGRSR